jgi:MerR family transcriptional regulator, thiopeptide resistance regulator
MSTFEMAGITGQVWKVGDLARATGLTVRALHYYEEIGLLIPSRRSSAGHRLYDAGDVARLYRISLLRGLGFPLEQIVTVLENPEWQLAAAVRRHLQHTQNRAAIATRLCTRLTKMAAELARQDNPSPEQLFSALEEMTMLDGTIHSTTGLLVYEDVDAAHDYIVRVFGLTTGHIERDPEGNAGYREVRAGDQVIGLHPAASQGFRSPRSVGAVTGMTVIAVSDADAHYARSVEAGVEIVCEPVDQPYGIREYGARDPEGQLWYFQSPLS